MERVLVVVVVAAFFWGCAQLINQEYDAAPRPEPTAEISITPTASSTATATLITEPALTLTISRAPTLIFDPLDEISTASESAGTQSESEPVEVSATPTPTPSSTPTASSVIPNVTPTVMAPPTLIFTGAVSFQRLLCAQVGAVKWTRQFAVSESMTRWDVWQFYVSPGVMSWERFEYEVLDVNQTIRRDGNMFKVNKIYLLPDCIKTEVP